MDKIQEVLHRAGSVESISERMYELEEDLDLDSEGRAVPSGSPQSRTVLGGKGAKIPHKLAKELGLVAPPAPKAGEQDEAQAEEIDAEAQRKAEAPQTGKAVRPGANKAQARGEDK